MRPLAVAACWLLAAAVPAGAQGLDPGPPGPYVVDVRGAVTGLPDGGLLLPDGTDLVALPARGAAIEAGGHVYPFSIGPARVGVGATLLWGGHRASAPGVDTDAAGVRTSLRALAPQVSLNFGTGAGWSYLSGGYGAASVSVEAADGTRVDAGWGAALNYGGGARWFLGRRWAVGFDVRAHQLQGRLIDGGRTVLPRTTLVAVAAGISLR